MLNCVYRLVAPRTFDPVEVDVPVGEKDVIVRPQYLSICNADMRYYLGKRDPRILMKKLPMALIHESVGEVLYDPSGCFSRGTKVVLLPNNPHEKDPVIGENYLRSSQFCGSGFDGFMQEYMFLPESRLVALPENTDLQVAAFTEIVSVAMHAINRFNAIAHDRRERIGVWGDGNLGYLVSLLLRILYPDAEIIVLGHNEYKMAEFTFVSETYHTDEIPGGLEIDHAFECCGGSGSEYAIDQIIDLIRPEGTISLMGVSENPVAINTRMVLEKGLRIFGSSRSARKDFEDVIGLYVNKPESFSYLSALVGNVFDVQNIADMKQAFEADLHKAMGKTIMEWNI